MSYKNVLFLGNSLLLGMFETYGMCATDSESDYAYYITRELKKREPECKISKLRISAFEACESYEEFENWFERARSFFKSDLDLISLQFLDNVNNEARQATLRKSFPELILRLRELCPRARIIWTYGWYMQEAVFDDAVAIADSFGIERIDISSAHIKDNESYSGQISLNAEGERIVVDDEWITHPGNSGMRAIADIMLPVFFKGENNV
jgi:hypothetical protein